MLLALPSSGAQHLESANSVLTRITERAPRIEQKLLASRATQKHEIAMRTGCPTGDLPTLLTIVDDVMTVRKTTERPQLAVVMSVP